MIPGRPAPIPRRQGAVRPRAVQPCLAIDHSQHGIHTRRGEFRLLPDGNGGTILRGTTWYEIQIAPEIYWKLWTGPIIGTIHQRVLEHIAARATAGSVPP